MAKFEVGIDQFFRNNAGTSEQERIRHFAKKEPSGEGRHRQKGRAADHSAQRFGKLQIGNRIRRNQINRATHGLVFDQKTNGPDLIFQRNPAHILPAASKNSTTAHFKRKQHFLQCAARGRQHDAGA